MKEKRVKIFRIALAGVLSATSLAFSACDLLSQSSSGSSSGNGNQPPVKVIDTTLNEALAQETGKVHWYLRGTARVATTNDASGAILGGEGIEEIVIEGDPSYGASLLGVGQGASAIQAREGATLVIKNMDVDDSSVPYRQTWEVDALEFGGKLRFENCTFDDRILLKDDAEAEFVNCSFYSPDEKRYAVWVLDGSASFKNCSFMGKRGLKIHEEVQYDADVICVSLENCTFDSIFEKPGISIGTIHVDPESTVVSVKNCTFTGCTAWDGDSAEGVDGFYETDTLTSMFVFTAEGVIIDGKAYVSSAE